MRGIRKIARLAGLLLLSLTALLMLAGITMRVAASYREIRTASQIAPTTGIWVQTSKGAMFLQQAGPPAGRAIVMTHGTGAWSGLWRETMDVLAAKGYRPIAVDLPPFGFSERPSDRSYARHDQAIRLRDVLDRLGIERAIVLGHSFGAGAAAEMALRFPERTSQLILVNAALGLPADGTIPADPPRWLSGLLGIGPLRDAMVSATLTNPLLTRQLLAAMLARKERALPQYVAILQEPMTLQRSTEDFGIWIDHFLSVDRGALSMSPEAWRGLEVPTSVLWGDRDTVTPIEQGARLTSLVRGAILVPIPGLGHIPQIEAPDLFQRALLEALGR